MVNYGRSRACLTCKKRRLKCDYTRPSCQRCFKIGKICPGYPDTWDLTFHNENSLVTRKVHGTFPAPISPATSISSDLKSWAINVFYRDYVLEVCGGCIGWLDFLPAMYEHASDDSILRLAMRSAAYANFAQKTERKDVEISAIAAYNRALNMTSARLTNCSRVPRETTMTAIFLLGLYENITSKVVEGPRQYHSKALGAMADLRGKLLQEGNGPRLLEIVCCQMQRQNLDLELGPGSADERLINLLDTSSAPSHAIINCYEVSKFMSRTRDFLLHGSRSRDWYGELHLQVQELDQRFHSWDRDASAALKFSNLARHADFKPHSNGERPPFDTYPAWIISLWNRNRAARILLHQQFLEAMATCEGERFAAYDAQQSLSQTMIRNVGDEILTSIPSALNYGNSLYNPSAPRSLGGYFMIWPLQVIMRCLFAGNAQRIDARVALEKVGTECGLSYAVTYARSFGTKNELESER